jgi:hypothetical protein
MTRLRTPLLAVALVLALSTVAGCGIPDDREPTDLDPAPATNTSVQP